MTHILTATGALRAWWAVGMLAAASVLVAGLSIAYTVHTQRASDGRWCSLLVVLDSPTGPQPSTPRAEQIQARIHVLSDDFGCPS